MSGERCLMIGGNRLILRPHGIETVVDGGGSVYAEPQSDADYRARSVGMGYGDDVLAMCRWHEALHTALAYARGERASAVMLAVAQGRNTRDVVYWREEDAVLRLQRVLNDLRRFLDGNGS